MGDLTDDRPASPCTGVCTLDDDDRCVGCARTLDEIAAWGSMSADEQRVVIAALPPTCVIPAKAGTPLLPSSLDQEEAGPPLSRG